MATNLIQFVNFLFIQDLESCIKRLHSSGYSAPDKTAVSGTSAGGLAVAVLCNTAPGLLKAAVLKVKIYFHEFSIK